MPVQRLLRRSQLQCSQCSERQMEVCSVISLFLRPICSQSQRPPHQRHGCLPLLSSAQRLALSATDAGVIAYPVVTVTRLPQKGSDHALVSVPPKRPRPRRKLPLPPRPTRSRLRTPHLLLPPNNIPLLPAAPPHPTPPSPIPPRSIWMTRSGYWRLANPPRTWTPKINA